MKESVLKAFFEDEIDATALSADLDNSIIAERGVIRYRIQDMDGAFQLRSEHLKRLCDAVINNQLDPKHLETIGFCILASDKFEYDTDTQDGDLVGEICGDWSSPEINYELTKENIEKFRERLVTGKDVFHD